MSIIKVSRVRDVCNERVKICTLFLHFIKLYTDMSRLPWSFKKEEKKKMFLPFDNTRNKKKKKPRKLRLKIIGTIIEIENYYITPFQDSLLINIFPWKKISKIHEHPIAQTPTPTILITDLTTIHLTLINLRISNIETNMRTRQISLPPSLPHPPRCPSLETSDVHDGNGSERKIRFTEFLLPSFSSPFPFFSANLSAEKSPP